MTGVRYPARYVSLRHNVQTGSGVHPLYYAVGTGVISSGCSGRDVKPATHHYPELRLRMRGVTPPLPPRFAWRAPLLSIMSNFTFVRCSSHCSMSEEHLVGPSMSVAFIGGGGGAQPVPPGGQCSCGDTQPA
jgi:hypothetical protein